MSVRWFFFGLAGFQMGDNDYNLIQNWSSKQQIFPSQKVVGCLTLCNAEHRRVVAFLFLLHIGL